MMGKGNDSTSKPHAAQVQDAAKRLRRVIIDKPPNVRFVLWSLAREYGRKLRPPLVIQRNGVGRLGDVPAKLSKLLADFDWETEVDRITQSFRRCGRVLSEMLTLNKSDTSCKAQYFVAQFLDFGGAEFVSSIKSSPSHGSTLGSIKELEEIQEKAPIAIQAIRRFIKREGPVDLPTAPSPARVFNELNALMLDRMDWDYEAEALGNAILKSYADLQITCTKQINVRGTTGPACFAVACFLGIEPDVGDELEGMRWRGFLRDWFPSDTSDEYRGSTGTEPFNPEYAIDPQRRVKRPGSGQTRKPGSRGDNRGHK